MAILYVPENLQTPPTYTNIEITKGQLAKKPKGFVTSHHILLDLPGGTAVEMIRIRKEISVTFFGIINVTLSAPLPGWDAVVQDLIQYTGFDITTVKYASVKGSDKSNSDKFKFKESKAKTKAKSKSKSKAKAKAKSKSPKSSSKSSSKSSKSSKRSSK